MSESKTSQGILIVGGNGFLGSHLARHLRTKSRVVVTYHRNAVPLEGILSLPIDVRDANAMKQIIKTTRPSHVIYLGGPEDSAWVNLHAKDAEKIFSTAVGDVLHAAEMISAKFLYVSSTSVFDGSRRNYVETDSVSPTSQLGKVKASGENFVRGRGLNASILRLSLLVGSAHPWRPSFFDRLRASLEDGQEVKLSDQEFHSWIPVSQAVRGIEALLNHSGRNPLLHLGGLARLTPYEMGTAFASRFGFDSAKITPVRNSLSPLDFSLNSSLAMRDLGLTPQSIEETFAEEFQF